jgi:hypothetical protein
MFEVQGLWTQFGETADIWKALLMVRMDTGWKPILLYAVARRDGFGGVLECLSA